MNNTFLLNDFYTLDSTEKNESGIMAKVRLNAAHEVFKGHFEQMPIVPGVCQTQIIKELLQDEVGQSLILSKGDNIKFTGMIIPGEHPVVSVELSYKKDDDSYIVEARLFSENTTFTKFKGTFAKV